MTKVKEAVRRLVCLLCGHAWTARAKNPKSCPNCKRYDWNQK